MAEKIQVLPTGIGTSDWKVVFPDTGAAIYDIHLELEATLRGRYYLLVDGEVRREGTFQAEGWDDEAVGDLLGKIVRGDYAQAQVDVRLPQRPGRAAGA